MFVVEPPQNLSARQAKTMPVAWSCGVVAVGCISSLMRAELLGLPGGGGYGPAPCPDHRTAT